MNILFEWVGLKKLRTRKLLLGDLPNDIIPTQSICRIQCVFEVIFQPSWLLILCYTSHITLHQQLRCCSSTPQLMLITSSRTRHDKFTMVFWSLKYSGDYILREIKYSFLVSKILSHGNRFELDCVFSNFFFFKSRIGCKDPCFIVNPLRMEVLKFPLMPQYLWVRFLRILLIK